MSLEEWCALRRQVRKLDRDAEPEILAPADAFSDRAAGESIRSRYLRGHDPRFVGPRSRTVLSRIGSSCAAWKQVPTPEEFYEAFHADEPDERQRSIISMWMQEATNDQIILAWAEGVYTMRDLARAIHKAGAGCPEFNLELNRLAMT